MAPIKFEEHIKEKLDGREIQPSSGSWERLNSRLENTRKRPGRKWWFSAAAAVAVLVVSGVLFLNQQNSQENQVVEEQTEEPVKASEKQEVFEEPVQLASEEMNEDKPESKKENISSEKSEIISPRKPVKNEENSRIAETNIQERTLIEPIFIKPPEQEEVAQKYNRQIEELLARVEKQENRNGEISEAEVNALLEEAARKISGKGGFIDKEDLSAAALLADVEFEIDQSFRKEVFEALKEGFLKARTAIANRNE